MPASTKPAPFSFGTNHPVFGSAMQKPTAPATMGMAKPAAPAVAGVAQPAPTPVLPVPPPQMFPAAPQPQPAAPQGMPQANAPGGGGIEEFLKNIIGPFLQQQGQMQQQQNQAQNAFRQDATFGRHLGMDGQPIAATPQAPLSFDQLRVPLADRIAKERATFGGQSFTAGDRTSSSLAAMAATQPGQQHFSTRYMPQQGATAPSFGSPVYRAQHPEYNMFSDANFPGGQGVGPSLLVGQHATPPPTFTPPQGMFHQPQMAHVPKASYAQPPQAGAPNIPEASYAAPPQGVPPPPYPLAPPPQMPPGQRPEGLLGAYGQRNQMQLPTPQLSQPNYPIVPSRLQMPPGQFPGGIMGAFDQGNPLRLPTPQLPMPRMWGQPTPPPFNVALDRMFAMP